MTPEMQLAQTLGGAPDQTQEKLAEAFDEMSLEDLEGFMKEKVALKASTVGSAFGKRMKQTVFGKQLGQIGKMAPAGHGAPYTRAHITDLGRTAGQEVGKKSPALARGMDRLSGNPEAVNAAKGVIKKAAIVADGVGRLMAKQANLLGAGLRMATRTPLATRAMAGAGIGAAGGVLKHMTSNDPNSTLSGSVLGGAALGAGAGAASRLGAKALLQQGKLPVAAGAKALPGAKGYAQTGVGAYARKALGEANKAGTAAATKAGTTGRQLALKPAAAAAAAPAVATKTASALRKVLSARG